MITTVTLNTSVDRRYTLKDFYTGGVFRAGEFQATAGGKGINVARVLKDIGEEVIATGFTGGNNGNFIEGQLTKLGIDFDFVITEGESRNCIAILSEKGTQTEVLEPGPDISLEELDSFKEKFIDYCGESHIITISGSLPRGVPENYYERLIDIATGKNVKVLLDASGKSLEYALNSRPYLIKPNMEELEVILNKSIKSDNDIIEAGRMLLRRGIECVVVSMGKRGAMVFNNHELYRVLIPEIKAVNPVGSGDSMVAGFAAAISRGYSIEKLAAFGAACGTANALEKETGKVNLQNINFMLNKIKIEKTKI